MPGALEPGHAHDLAWGDVHREAVQLPGHVDVLQPEPARSAGVRGLPVGGDPVLGDRELAADHGLDQPAQVDLAGGCIGQRDPAVPEHRDPVRDPHHLLEEVRDVEDGEAFARQRAQHAVQSVDRGL